jgi:hypothetical protein
MIYQLKKLYGVKRGGGHSLNEHEWRVCKSLKLNVKGLEESLLVGIIPGEAEENRNFLNEAVIQLIYFLVT